MQNVTIDVNKEKVNTGPFEIHCHVIIIKTLSAMEK